jgi:3-methylcrotonyl-CoA carboxylase alpha subunit
MNTRLQVEHPVTEEITGQDLVEWQLRVASGEALPLHQDELIIEGHAIEVRLYAEDASNGFLPSTGKLRLFDIGSDAWDTRIETGFSEGDEVSPFYDPMIAKLVVKSWDRESAIEQASAACQRVRVWPVKTNAWFAKRLLDDQKFQWGMIDTGMIDRSGDRFTSCPTPSDTAIQHALQAHLFFSGAHQPAAFSRTGIRRVYPLGWRLNSTSDASVLLSVCGKQQRVKLDSSIDTSISDFHEVDGHVLVSEDGATFDISPYQPRGSVGGHGAADGVIAAPMPGKVTAVEVSAGEKVSKGQRLLTLEAMKMEHGMTAPFDGTVAELSATVGAQVSEGAILARIEPQETK